jgi:hypothetical protein
MPDWIGTDSDRAERIHLDETGILNRLFTLFKWPRFAQARNGLLIRITLVMTKASATFALNQGNNHTQNV